MERARRGRRGAHPGGPRWGLGRKQKGDRAARFATGVTELERGRFPALSRSGDSEAHARREGAAMEKAEAGQDGVIRVGKKEEQGGWLCG